MADEDPTEDLARVVMTLGAGSSRALEILNRGAQDRKQQQARQAEAQTEPQLRRWGAQAAVADRTLDRYDRDFVRTADAGRVAGAWDASRTWADVDPERFGGHHERISRDVATECGLSVEDLRGDPSAAQMTASGLTTRIEQGRLVAQVVDPEAATARVAADKQTPYRAAENQPTGAVPTTRAVSTTVEATRTRDSGRSR